MIGISQMIHVSQSAEATLNPIKGTNPEFQRDCTILIKNQGFQCTKRCDTHERCICPQMTTQSNSLQNWTTGGTRRTYELMILTYDVKGWLMIGHYIRSQVKISGHKSIIGVIYVSEAICPHHRMKGNGLYFMIFRYSKICCPEWISKNFRITKGWL